MTPQEWIEVVCPKHGRLGLVYRLEEIGDIAADACRRRALELADSHYEREGCPNIDLNEQADGREI